MEINPSLYDLDIFPISRILWKETAINEKIDCLFNSMNMESYLAELRTVSKKYRKCATFHIRSDCFDNDIKLLNSMDLVFVPIRRAKRVSGFAHRFYTPKENEPYDVFGVVSYEKKYAEQFANADFNLSKDAVTNNEIIGELLGYPDCCIEFFNETWNKGIFDPILPAVLNTEGNCVNGNEIRINSYPETNIIYRYFGLRIVPHLIHSFKCNKSKDFAKMFLEVMDQNTKDEMLKFLSLPVTWNCYKGVALIENKYLVGIANSMPYRESIKVILNE